MPAKTHLFVCLKDNYGVLLHDPSTGATAAIDAPEAAPIEKALSDTGWRLSDILVTHHHGDHTAGIPALKQKYGCRVVAPRAAVAQDGQIERGKYLVTLGGCNDCHTPDYFFGKPDMARFLGGSDVGFEMPGLGTFVGPNLTPDTATESK